MRKPPGLKPRHQMVLQIDKNMGQNICHHHRILPFKHPEGRIAERHLISYAVYFCIFLRHANSNLVDINAHHLGKAELCRCYGKNARARAHIEHAQAATVEQA